jgi:hypothetical protein
LRYAPGQSGNPAGRPKGTKNKITRKADEAFELVFDALQLDDTTKLQAWAKDNLTEFYKLFAKKLTTTAENQSHVVTETVSHEQARLMAEEYIATARDSVVPEVDPVHGGDAAGLPAREAPPADR